MSVLGILYQPTRTVIDAPIDGSFSNNPLSFESSGFRQQSGGVAGIVIDATITETHSSKSSVTENPIESGGSFITDHVKIEPKELVIEGVISDTPIGHSIIGNIQNLVRNASVLFGGSSRSVDAFQDLLDLQKSRRPFTVVTGLKRYTNMILIDLTVPRNVDQARALHFTATMREVFLVQSSELDFSQTVLGPKKRDNGQKVTNPVPQESPLGTPSLEEAGNGTFLNNLRDWIIK